MKSILLAAIIALISLPDSRACLWDSDTLATEKARLPGVSEIMAGIFPRHSRAFYEWRVKQCEAALAKDKSLVALYDDLAVAQHKLGNHKAAITTMQTKEKVKPGLYETYSNLGTFYIYTGELKEAVVWIDKALAINGNAHFGREKYQKWLVEWVLAGTRGPTKEEDAPFGGSGYPAPGFAFFVIKKQGITLRREGITKALEEAKTGVLGMMRFADFDNPLLQEALGDILSAGWESQNAGHLAAQAYLMALCHIKSSAEMPRVQKKFENAGRMHEGWDRKALQADLKAALAKGEALTGQVAKDEVAWIAAGKDASIEFTVKYLSSQVETKP